MNAFGLDETNGDVAPRRHIEEAGTSCADLFGDDLDAGSGRLDEMRNRDVA